MKYSMISTRLFQRKIYDHGDQWIGGKGHMVWRNSHKDIVGYSKHSQSNKRD